MKKMNFKPVTDFFGKVLERFGAGYFFGQPAETITLWFLLAFFIISLALVLGYYFLLRLRAKKQKPYESYAKTFFWLNFTLVVGGLVNLFSRYENLTVLSWRIWMYLILAVLLAFNGWFFVKRQEQLREELLALVDNQRKSRWLKSTKKRKKKS
jgi:cbb3-type cytochrome oxidase subunit 3